MAEPITIQKLIEASMDSDSLEVLVNGDENAQVTTRLGQTYPSAKKAINTMFANGGLPAKPFVSKPIMVASSLPDGSYAQVTDSPVDNGLYLKVAGAWVKSSYDPLNQSKEFVKATLDVLDVSALSGNYKLTLTQALVLVPTDLRKGNLIIKFNTDQEYKFVLSTYTAEKWSDIRFWVRPYKIDADDRVNYFDESMIYKGFILRGYGYQTVLGADNYVAIIPIIDKALSGQKNRVSISTGIHPLKTTDFYFLDAEFNPFGAQYVSALVDYELPLGTAYVLINLELKDASGVITGAGNLETARKHLTYTPNHDKALISEPTTVDGFETVEYGLPPSTAIEYSLGGQKAVNPYFVGGLKPFKGIHITQIVKSVEIFKGHYDLTNKLTGEYRKFTITEIQKTSSGAIDVLINAEQNDGVIGFLNIPRSISMIDGLFYQEYSDYTSTSKDPISVRLVIDSSVIPNNTILYFNENGQIHPSIVAFADRAQGRNKGEQITEFMDVGVSSTRSNMQLPPAEPLSLSREMINGFPVTTVVGDEGLDHQQTTLISSKKSNFYSNDATIYVDASSDYPTNPSVGRLRVGSSVSGQAGNGVGNGLIGGNDNQWIHPDMCYASTPVAGYKYWMVDSVFPNGDDRREDVELFVGNTGTDWVRVKGFSESDTDNVGFKLPEVFWDTNYPNAFLPIPKSGNTFEFAKESVTETSTVMGYLNHDPAITYHNGYVIAYILFNFGFTDLNDYNHKYMVCLRTNNGSTWEIVRQDGSTMPYNKANSKLLFTRTNGIRNHHYYKTTVGSIASRDLSPQMVKVSNNEFHMYTRDDTEFTTPGTGLGVNLVRYSGTTPYTINYASPQIISRDDITSGNLWHFGMRFYNGKYYLLTNGFMLTSTDGIYFTNPTHPFFWRGMSLDLYKPTFVVGHDNKVKIAYGFQHFGGVPHAYAPQISGGLLRNNLIFDRIANMGTLTCEYLSLADIESRGANAAIDAYADISVTIISQRTKSSTIHLIPAVRGFTKLKNIKVSYGDEIYVVAYLNTRNGGSLTFGGVAVTEENAIYY